MVRATRGSRSGPITISATTPMTSSSENPMSNIARGLEMKKAPQGRLMSYVPRESRSGLVFGLAAHFAFDRLGGDLPRRRLGRLVRAAFAHAVLEAAHRAAKIRADVAQLLGAEDQHHDHQDDQPMPDAERAHLSLLSAICASTAS